MNCQEKELMLKFFKDFLFTDPTEDWKAQVDDPVLGSLVLNDDATWW